MNQWLSKFNGHFYYFKSIDSTQAFIHRHPPTDRPIICLADEQIKGIGQRGTKWVSNAGQLYFSIQKKIQLPVQNLQGITQQIALSLCQYLDYEDQIKIKWPNDLFIRDKKLAGILVESRSVKNAGSIITIGIGINVTRSCPNDYAYYSDIQSTKPFNRDDLFELIFDVIADWQEKPYLALDNKWSHYDRFSGQMCQLENYDRPMKIIGIDQNGRLIAKDNDKIHFLTQTRIQSCIS